MTCVTLAVSFLGEVPFDEAGRAHSVSRARYARRDERFSRLIIIDVMAATSINYFCRTSQASRHHQEHRANASLNFAWLHPVEPTHRGHLRCVRCKKELGFCSQSPGMRPIARTQFGSAQV